jgi:predicted nucleotidyltransferase|tara:strand:- start:430 stop:750 length:321 start_codon:yes stop_codon:yes gene_type:complete
MNKNEKNILDTFKSSLQKRLPIYKIILFGSRARGDSTRYSDMDVVVIVDKNFDKNEGEYISDCAWEAGFEKGIVVVPVIFTRDEWENSPERYSLFAQAIEAEGVPI